MVRLPLVLTIFVVDDDDHTSHEDFGFGGWDVGKKCRPLMVGF
jgi:hypothetical protein